MLCHVLPGSRTHVPSCSGTHVLPCFAMMRNTSSAMVRHDPPCSAIFQNTYSANFRHVLEHMYCHVGPCSTVFRNTNSAMFQNKFFSTFRHVPEHMLWNRCSAILCHVPPRSKTHVPPSLGMSHPISENMFRHVQPISTMF